ncbi:MAG: DNA replication/repair protein RecF [Oscillospiraceae bacterium]|nr:DNA replication/repair protein RecF [Oscillospiraceae bacterium]
MELETLTLTRFRNYSGAEAVFHPDCNVLTGANAQGKTNLLEAIVCLSGMKPPRVRADRDMIQFDADNAAISAQIRARGRTYLVEIRLSRDGRRKITVNGVHARTPAELRERFHTVLFRPEDLLLIRDAPATRRHFLDTALSQLRPRYADALAYYQAALARKSRILRDAAEHPGLLRTLPDFSTQMVRYGAVLVRYRAHYTQRLHEYAARHHAACSGGHEQLAVSYRTVSTVTDPSAPEGVIQEQLHRHMEAHERAELAAKQCLSGAHRDDLSITVDGRDARTWASQGQTRTAALSLKLAEREILRNASGEYPVLLLDDVLSELDPVRQSYVLREIEGGQRFLTCCEDDRLSDMPPGQVYRVRNGCLSAENVAPRQNGV